MDMTDLGLFGDPGYGAVFQATLPDIAPELAACGALSRFGTLHQNRGLKLVSAYRLETPM